MMQSLARWKYGLAAEPYQVDSGPRLRRQHCAAALDVGEPPHGAVYHDRGLLFCWSDGRPIYPETITDHFNRLVDRAGLPLITPHDVRHTYATMSLRAGVNPKIVSTRLGHATVAFTLDTYTEDVPGVAPRGRRDRQRAVPRRRGGSTGRTADRSAVSPVSLGCNRHAALIVIMSTWS